METSFPGTTNDNNRKVGNDGLPIRALAFSSGGFDTAMQLGVAHALLVIQGKPPDAVVGISAGAVNAAALAEIFHAAPSAKQSASATDRMKRTAQLEARVQRFRRIMDAFQRAPAELLQALVPDPFQLDAQRPLVPLELPIHHKQERDGRQEQLQARAGLIRLFNRLLELRVPLGTLTRAVRRVLGIMAAHEVRPRWRRVLLLVVETARTWLLAGFILPRLAPLFLPLVVPLFRRASREERGATAGELIFQSRIWRRCRRAALEATSLLVLWLGWVGVSALAAVILGFPLWLLAHGVTLDYLRGVQLYRPANWPLSWWPGWVDWQAAPLSPRLAWISWEVAPLVTAGLGILALLVAAVRRPRSRTAFVQGAGEVLGFLLVLGVGLAGLLLIALAFEVPIQSKWPEAVRSAWTLVQWTVLAAGILGLLGILGLVAAARRRGTEEGKGYLTRLLAEYDLASGLLSSNPLRQILTDILDPDYYGADRMDDVVERALKDDPSPATNQTRGKLLGDYGKGGIEVGVGVANVATGRLEVLPDRVRVIDGLLAATAVAPALKPQRIEGRLYVDGANITGEATRLLIDFLRDRVNPEASVLHVYPVVSLPFSRGTLGKEEKPRLSLVEVVTRALQLQRLRDATLERRLTEIYTRAIPPRRVRFPTSNGKQYLRAWVSPIEPEAPLNLTRQLTEAEDGQARRDLVARTVADGCRAALEVMIRPSLGTDPVPPAPAEIMRCRRAVERHLAKREELHGKPLPELDFPGAGERPEDGPGLPEVCRHCVLQKPGSTERMAPQDGGQSIRVHPWSKLGPAWPREGESERPEHSKADPHFAREPTSEETKAVDALRLIPHLSNGDPGDAPLWPRPRDRAPEKRPLVSLLFSGGVFRGVYQLGALAALSETEVQPDIIAGASVGSITAALVAEAFSQKSEMSSQNDGQKDTADEADPTDRTVLPGRGRPLHGLQQLRESRQLRRAKVARLAATYLALDQLILTDRFADFIRTFTLRAAASDFSLRQADRFFRRYDAAAPGGFNREARRVVAGLERLLYVSPFELKDLVKAIRLRDLPETRRLLESYLQELLDRTGWGREMLGAEPLSLLIREHVLTGFKSKDASRKKVGPSRHTPVPFDAFLKRSGIYFLATTTNLTRGELEVLGERQLLGGGEGALLEEGLLASSAFPAVFRPRWGTELKPMSVEQHQYIDGGVIDNLPLDAVAHFLVRAAQAERVAARPRWGPDSVHVPHLIFAASLEEATPALGPARLSGLEESWPALWKRARMLQYNKKLQEFQEAQRDLREIWEERDKAAAEDEADLGPELLDLEVATVIPEWLCGTFAFHPMLGFSRERQAESIAHGCATTLVRLGRLKDEHPTWAEAWGIDPGNTLEIARIQKMRRGVPLHPDPPGREGDCWLRKGERCPFSGQELTGKEYRLEPRTVRELNGIHTACLRPETHRKH